MRALLNLSDFDLVQEIDRLEKLDRKSDAALGRFQSIRSKLSRIAWSSYAEALGCDSGPISKVGVTVLPMDEVLADRLLAALLASPKTTMRHDDFSLGYMRTESLQCEYMNACNEYRELSQTLISLLDEFLATIGSTLTQIIGHPFRFASTRQFQLVPRHIAADKHVDGWPPAIRKLFILPRGAGNATGTTWFHQRDGKEFVLESNKPIWVIFENSVIWHAPVTGSALRPTIELAVVPARYVDLEPVNAGVAGWYPWFPAELALHEGTRMALTQCYADDASKGWRELIRRFTGR